MSKNFTFKEVKQAMNYIKNITSKLSSASYYREEKLHAIKDVFDSINDSNYFTRLADAYINGKNINETNYNAERLIILVNQYINSEEINNKIIELSKSIENDTSSDMKLLRSGSNFVSWMFTSSKKKQLVDEAYKRIVEYIDLPIIKESQDELLKLEALNKISYDSIKDDFSISKKIYEKCIRKIITDPDGRHLIEAISDVFSSFETLMSIISRIKENISKDKKEIEESIEYYLASELLVVLRNIPIEEVNREKKGFRIKTLREAGYSNIADIYSASIYNLSSINGISRDVAITLKRIAEDFLQKAKQDFKIKLSYDNQSKGATKVVNKIYTHLQKKKLYLKIDNSYQVYKDLINQANFVLNDVGSGRFWLFYDDEYKNRVKNYYDDFYSIVYGEFGRMVRESYDIIIKAVDNVKSHDSWEDFKNNSIEYYNIIEEVWPGILGNNDLLYGLPESLARSIQDEAIYPDGLYCTLRRYQEWGVKYILHQERVLLGDEMGLGKTIQAIATMVSLKNTGASHFIVVCPASVLSNWCREITKHSKLRVIKGHGTGKRYAISEWIRVGGVIVTTYESTSSFSLDPTFRYSLLVVDEAHYIKNRGAARSARTIQLSKYAERILFMTGTALENRVDEMISLIDILRPDIASSAQKIAYLSNAPQFREKIAPVYYRRKRESVLTELPELIEKKEWCSMTTHEEYEYEEAVLSKNYMRARRVSWNVSDLKYSSKMNRLKEIIEEAKNDDRKILVFSFFLDTISKIIDELGTEICLNPINGSVNPKRRLEIIDEFEEAPAGTVLCAQIQSGGTGLNIQAASVVVICEPQVKPSIENQAISRAYRMGQSRNVLVFRLLCEDTIDERMLDILEKKQIEFDAFADKSVAAESVEIDDSTLGDIIKDEIDRINKKRANKSEVKKTIEPVKEWEKAKDSYRGLPLTVTQRIKMVSQPYGGYINPRDMDVIEYQSSFNLNPEENVAPNIVGTVVDYLTRFMLEKNAMRAFDISIKGANNVGEYNTAISTLINIRGLDDESICSAVKLVYYDVAYRLSAEAYNPLDVVLPNKSTIENIREMVNRSLLFFNDNGPVIKYEYTFTGGFTKVIGAGDGDFMTNDTLWDFKVSKNEPKNQYTFQLLVYYVMGLHSIYPEYKNIKYLGIFNPRLNKKYTYSVDKLSDDIIKRVEEEVIGY